MHFVFRSSRSDVVFTYYVMDGAHYKSRHNTLDELNEDTLEDIAI